MTCNELGDATGIAGRRLLVSGTHASNFLSWLCRCMSSRECARRDDATDKHSSGVRRRFRRARRRRIALSLAGQGGDPDEKALACGAGADFSHQDFLRDDLRSSGVESLGSAQEAVCCPSMLESTLCVSHAHAYVVCACACEAVCMCVRGVVWTYMPGRCVIVTNGTWWQVGARTREYVGGRFRAAAGGSPRMSRVCFSTCSCVILLAR
jgi:hypothetical protein